VGERQTVHAASMLVTTYMVDAELDKDNEIVVDNVVFAVRPVAHTCTAPGLVGVLPTAVQLVFAVLDSVDVVVGELGSLVVEAVGVGDDLLERRRVNLVSHGLAIDWISHSSVLDLECPVSVRVEIVAAGLFDQGLFSEVPGAVGVKVGAWHGVGFVVDETVVVAV